MNENRLSFAIRGALFRVYDNLGPGLLESVYEVVLAHELRKERLEIKTQAALPLVYENLKFDAGFRVDLLVNDKVIIEIKSVERLAEVHHKQLITYLKLSGKKLGILVNFNTDDLSTSIFRKVNGL